jgi:hypothetical protein
MNTYIYNEYKIIYTLSLSFSVNMTNLLLTSHNL